MTELSLARALDFIRNTQNTDGGWGYGRNRASLVEPTGFCALSLRSQEDRAASGRGLDFLRACQMASGAVGLKPGQLEGSWMAYAALLAFHGLDADMEENRLRTWALGFEDASSRFTKAELAATKARYRYDASIPGWSWTPRMTAWVEPTALFILALRRTGVPVMNKRIVSGVDLLMDRRVPSGGWNFGNPFSSAHMLEASVLSTAIALAALGTVGASEDNQTIAAGLRFLKRCLDGYISTISLAWSLLALKSFAVTLPLTAALTRRLADLQNDDGSFRTNPFETALTYLILTDAPILRPAARGPR